MLLEFSSLFIDAFLIIAYYFIIGILSKGFIIKKPARAGFFAGCLGIFLMIYSVPLGKGIILDLRHIPLIFVSVFAGPVAALICACMIGLGRVFCFGYNEISLLMAGMYLLIGIGCAWISTFTWKVEKKVISSFIYAMMILSASAVYVSVHDVINVLSWLWGSSVVVGLMVYWLITRLRKESLQSIEIHKMNQELKEKQKLLEAQKRLLTFQKDNLHYLFRQIQQQEEQYRTLANLLPDGMAVHQDGKLIYLNLAGSRMFGLDSPEEWLYKPILDIVSPEYHELALKHIQEIYQEKETSLTGYKLVKKDGTLMDVEIAGTRLQINDQPAFMVVIRDVTVRKEAEQKLKEVNRQLQILANVDGLTGIPNRRCFDETLRREWKDAFRYQRPISLILFDIDYFKKFNDTNGHQEGDDVLRQVAGAMVSCLRRPKDVGCRYGGEEFALILPETDRDGALFVAESVREAIESLSIHHHTPNVSERITASLGVVTCIPTSQIDETKMIKLADQALYQSKRLGRNQVQFSSIKSENENCS